MSLSQSLDMYRGLPSAEAAVLPPSEVAHRLQTDTMSGLDSIEAGHRLTACGPNELVVDEPEPLWKRYLEGFQDPMIGLLLGSATLSAILGQFSDATSIFVAVILVTTVGFVQEYRSDQSLKALKSLAPYHCTVYRDGAQQDLLARDLVAGDLVRITVGDRVPADLRLVEAVQLHVDESNLTGETNPSEKITDPAHEPGRELAERHNVAFMGTLVTQGHGHGIVIGTGKNTEMGHIFDILVETDEMKTPLQVRMDALGQRLTVMSFVIIGGIVLLGLIQRRPLMEMFTIGVSLAVAAIPEGLPIVVTVTLALGVLRMSRQQAVVKKLPAVEALGCASVICVDKTGTLTQNAMTVRKVFSFVSVDKDQYADFSGTGYEPRGEVTVEGIPVTPLSHPNIGQVLEAGSLCNNAHYVVDDEGQPTVSGQPTELAILAAAAKFGSQMVRSQFVKSFELPFSSANKWMAVRGSPPESSGLKESRGAVSRPPSSSTLPPMVKDEAYFVKGTVEGVLSMCTSYITGRDLQRGRLTDQLRKRIFAAEAHMAVEHSLRVLAVASGPSLNVEDGGLCFAGLIGIVDPLREGVVDAVRTLSGSGVHVAMITGDAQATAMAIAKNLGLVDTDTKDIEAGHYDHSVCMSGRQIEELDDVQLSHEIGNVHVFYRAAPVHKLKLVRAYQLRGAVVAMTGDGVNDAPALKAAEIGIAMGKSGTDVCKEAADMVLLDDNFATILPAIEEGKAIFFNIRNFVRFQLSTSIAALCLVAFSTVFGYPNPLNAMQILWINIIMDGPPAQSLGVEPVDPDIVRQPPRHAKEAIITRTVLWRVALAAILVVAGTLLVFVQEMHGDNVINRRDTTMTFTTFVMFDMFNALSCRSATKSILHVGLFTNKTFLFAVGGSILGQLLVVYFPPLQSVFQTEGLYFADWLYICCISSTILWADEIVKAFVLDPNSVHS